MLLLELSEKEKVLSWALSQIGKKYENGYNCIDFVKDAYGISGISTDFNQFPYLSPDSIYKEESIGYLCFLKHKIHVRDRRFSHVGIIAQGHTLIHYSRYFGKPNVREVFLTPFEEIFEIYELAFKF